MRRLRSILTIITIATVAALPAPLSVLADTTPPPAPSPAPAPTPAPAPSPIPAPQAPANPVRIGLGRTLTAAEVTAKGNIAVVAEGVVQWQPPAGQVLKVSLAGGQIQVEGLAKAFAGPVRFIPLQPGQVLTPPSSAPSGTGTTGTGTGATAPAGGATAPTGTTDPAQPVIGPAPANPINFKGKTYRGEIEVLISPESKGTKLSVVNVVNMDEYLAGVVPYEMSPSWPAEALKAQAIASRTYLLGRLGRYPGEGFDLTDTTADQVYGGLQKEDPRATAAVAATRGQVVTYNGKLAQTLYFSSSGGATESNQIAFRGAPIDYLQSVPDFDNVPNNPYFTWQKVFTLDQLSTLIQSRYQVGKVTDLQQVGQASASGRPSTWQVTGTAGTATLTGEQLRTVLGLLAAPKSATVKNLGELPGNRTLSGTVYVVGADGKVAPRQVAGAVVRGVSGTATAAAANVVALGPKVVSINVEFSGGGWGHGVGMSQWGANGLAQLGKSYTDILAHYYRGTKVEIR